MPNQMGASDPRAWRFSCNKRNPDNLDNPFSLALPGIRTNHLPIQSTLQAAFLEFLSDFSAIGVSQRG